MKQFKNKKGQHIGVLNRKGNYIKHVTRKEHHLHSPGGYGVDRDVIEKLDGDCERIVIIEDNSKAYVVEYDRFVKKSFMINRGHGDQMVLCDKYWDIVDRDGAMLQEGYISEKEVQANLFDMWQGRYTVC